MPLYDYQCPGCGHEFEALHGINQKAPACPECRGRKCRRLIGGAAIKTTTDGTAARVEGEIKKRLGQGRAGDALRLAEKAASLAGNRPGMGKIKAAADKLRGHLKGK